MNRRSRFEWLFAASFGLTRLLIPTGALAIDLETLVRVLVPAYMAQNFTEFCVRQDPHFLSELKYGPATAYAFAEKVKRKATIDLPEDDAHKVRIAAADAAREISRHEFSLIGIGSPDEEPASSVKRWCDRSANPFVVEIMSRHESAQLEIRKILEAAKD